MQHTDSRVTDNKGVLYTGSTRVDTVTADNI